MKADGSSSGINHRDMGTEGPEPRSMRFQPLIRYGAGFVVFLSIVRNPLPNLVTLAQVALLVLVVAALLATPGRRAAEWGRLGQLGVSLPLILTGWLLCTTAWNVLFGGNIDFVQAVRDLRDLAIFSTGFAAVTWLDRDGAGRLLKTALFAIGSGCAVELLTRHTGVYGLLFEPEFMGYRARAGFQGPNEYGALASIAVAMAVGFALEARSARERTIAIAIALIGAFALVGSLSRGGLGGTVLAVGIVIAVFVWDTAVSGHSGRVYRIAVVASIVLLAGIGATMFVRRSTTGTVVEMVLNRLGGNVLDAGVGDRMSLVNAAFQIGASQPMTGGGMGAFSAQNASLGGSGTLSPHNELAKTFASGGVIGVGILLLWMLSLLGLVLRKRRAPRGYAALGGVAAFVIAEQFFTYLVRPGLSVAIAIVLAAVVGLDLHQGSTWIGRRPTILGADLNHVD